METISVKNSVKPFLKWAGGKGQLIDEIKRFYPFNNNVIKKYAEPFVGGGAVLFDILNKYNLDEIYISDINAELINTYRIIRDEPDALISLLFNMQSDFLPLNEYERKKYYIEKRLIFNTLKASKNTDDDIQKAALFIFLNKTCFNGLFRVNKKGEFNVPMGSYKRPLICDELNIRNASEKLKNVIIVCGDYRASEEFIDNHTFVYCDPPYRPISSTSSFTAYSENPFDDDEQIEIANFVNRITHKGAKVLLSNSDPKNLNPEDTFFETIYSKYNIQKVNANRMINCKKNSRGKIKELIISNF